MPDYWLWCENVVKVALFKIYFILKVFFFLFRKKITKDFLNISIYISLY